MTEETYSWIFVDTIPLLYDEKKVARQKKVETWLDLYQLTRELNIGKTENKHNANATINYVS